MTDDTSGPLNNTNYTEINRALGLLNNYEIACERAERAGFPVEEHKLACQYYRKLFDKVKLEYFKHKP
jgi:hypothetical protein